MPTALIPAAIGGVSSILGGIMGGKPKTTTSTMTPQWSPDQQALMAQLQKYSSGLLSDPSAGTDPIKQNAIQQTNSSYSAIPDQISRQMASRGYGSSGNFGNSMYQTAFAKANTMSNIDSQMAQMILNQKNQGASLSDQLLAMTRGSTTKTTGPGTAASDGFMSAGNGLSNISTLMTLSKLLKGGGSYQQPDGSQMSSLGTGAFTSPGAGYSDLNGGSGGSMDSGGDSGWMSDGG